MLGLLVKLQDPGSRPFHSELLGLLQSSTRSAGLTPGQLRAALAAKAGVRRDLAEVRAACHELWLRDQVVIEPPGRDKREYRVWHASYRRAPIGSGARREEARPAAPGRATREGDAQENFRITLCGQLAGEWARSGCGETRDVLRRVLMNFGAERVERAGEVVPFKGRRHECNGPVLPGGPVRVTEEGWILRQGTGEYLLVKARVVSVKNGS
jgi:hypothetical protein